MDQSIVCQGDLRGEPKYTVSVDVIDWHVAQQLADVILDFLRPNVEPGPDGKNPVPRRERTAVWCGPKKD